MNSLCECVLRPSLLLAAQPKHGAAVLCFTLYRCATDFLFPAPCSAPTVHRSGAGVFGVLLALARRLCACVLIRFCAAGYLFMFLVLMLLGAGRTFANCFCCAPPSSALRRRESLVRPCWVASGIASQDMLVLYLLLPWLSGIGVRYAAHVCFIPTPRENRRLPAWGISRPPSVYYNH